MTTGTIEFRCKQCDKLLRCGESYAGRDAKCPQCGSVQTIPAPRANGPGAEAPPAAPSPAEAATVDPPAPPADGDGQQPSADSNQAVAPSGMDSYGQSPGGGGPGAAPPESAGAVTASPAAADVPPAVAPAPREHLPTMSAMSEGTGESTPTKELFDRIMEQVRKIYFGQDELVLGTLVALFSGGHVLIESFPGLGKTLFVRTLGQVLGCEFARIQFTADLMPSDITGAPIFDMKQQEFRFRPGPVFTQLLLADEINRSPAKTHAALLEIMQEYHVTVDNTTHKLERPFLVMATQNPIESEGTYNLPEAQLDRFMMKLVLDYPSVQEEADVLRMHSTQVEMDQRLTELETVTSPAEIMEITRQSGEVRIDERLLDYINALVRLTREWPHFHMGASPRAGLAMMQAARTLAAFRGRDYAVPDDVVDLALPTLRHRVILTAEAEVEGRETDELLSEMVRTVEVPRL